MHLTENCQVYTRIFCCAFLGRCKQFHFHSCKFKTRNDEVQFTFCFHNLILRYVSVVVREPFTLAYINTHCPIHSLTTCICSHNLVS